MVAAQALVKGEATGILSKISPMIYTIPEIVLSANRAAVNGNESAYLSGPRSFWHIWRERKSPSAW